MATTISERETIADLLERLGGVPAERVRLRPPPGTATESDVLEVEARENRLCELVDGVLVEKAVGFKESLLAGWILATLRSFVVPRNLGLVLGADGMMRLSPGLVRIPDVSFVSWARLRGGKVPTEPIPAVAPDLAVEVLSPGNTKAEMIRKLREYFEAGVRLVWLVDPERRAVTVHTALNQSVTRAEKDMLDGADVLPGFAVPLAQLFAELDRRAGP